MTLTLVDSDIVVIKDWWKWLEANRGARAKLRRATSADEVMMQAGLQRFIGHKTKEGRALSSCWREPKNRYFVAMVCGLLAKVAYQSKETIKKTVIAKQQDGVEQTEELASFIELLAKPASSGGRPRMSELRFARLQQSRDEQEFYLQMSRAIDLLDKTVPLASLVSNTIHWQKERQFGVHRDPARRMSVLWATEYFTTLEYFSKQYQ